MSGDDLDRPPDPSEAGDPTEFVHRLNELRRWAGQPSLRELRVLAGRSTRLDGSRGDVLPLSSTSALLNGRGLPRLPRMIFVEALVTACLRLRHLAATEVDVEVRRWLGAWRQLAAAPENVPVRVANGDGNGHAGLRRTAAPWPAPRQLPAHLPRFVGRISELGCLSTMLDGCAGGGRQCDVSMTAAQSEAVARQLPGRAGHSEFVAPLSLAAINLVAIGGERREAGEASKARYELSAGYQIEGDSIHYRFDVDCHLTDDDATDMGQVRASVIVTISTDAAPDERGIELFGTTSALMIAHPYLREALASTAQRLGFPGVLMPLRTQTPQAARPGEG